MSTILLHHCGKTTTPFADAPVEKRLAVENETTLISAKNRVDLSSISEVRSYITEWPRFLGHPVNVQNIS